jgi:zinc transport system substrate-binding protein
MNKMLIRFFIYTMGLIVVVFVSCQSKKRAAHFDGVVVATTAWTAAYAETAGAKEIIILAPFEMEHPSEYELRPGDIPNIMNAELMVYAGYEVMTDRLKKGLDLPQEKLLLVNTDYRYETIEQSVMKIAEHLGTEDIARDNLFALRKALDDGRSIVREKKMSGKPVMVHRFQSSIVRELGLTPTVFFGPSAPEASEIAGAAKKEVFMIIDNFHNPVGQPLKEVLSDKKYVQFLNFPGLKGTKTLTDVIRYNISQIVAE